MARIEAGKDFPLNASVFNKAGFHFNVILIWRNFIAKNIMEHSKEFDDLNKKSLEKFDEYLKTKSHLGEEHHEKLKEAKEKWQSSWTDLMQVLLYLETIEI